MQKLLLIIVCLGAFLIVSGCSDSSGYDDRFTTRDVMSRDTGLETENDELRARLEAAKLRLEDARISAEAREDAAMMRFLNSGSTNDLLRLQRAQDALDDIDDAIASLDD